MALAYPRIALTSRDTVEDKDTTLKAIADIILSTGAELFVDPERCAVPSLKNVQRFSSLSNVDLIVIAGGDGTILRTVKEMTDFSVPLLALNHGTVGFLTECDTDECRKSLSEFISSGGEIDERGILSCSVVRDGKEIISGRALNEIVIGQGGIARLIRLKASINDRHLALFRADGLIVATPTGSTAYNLAAGGPILHPHSRDIILTPINAYAFTQRPLAIPDNEKVVVEVVTRSEQENVMINLTLDGQTHHLLQENDRIIITSSSDRVKFLRRDRNAFYETLRGKLGWG